MHAGWSIVLLTVASLADAQSLVVSTSGSCANAANETCVGSRWGDCCSQNGFCGSNATYCGGGCQSDFGGCYDDADTISVDGGCGSDGMICLGSIFGNCCSATGFCGSTDSYCGSGCQDAYGACGDDASNATVSTTIAASARPATSSATSTVSSRTSAVSTSSSATDTSTPSNTAATSTSSASSLPASASIASDQPQSITSSTGFKAGMAIMAIILAAILSILAWFFFVRRPRQQDTHAVPPQVYPREPPAVVHEKSGASVTYGKASTISSQSELDGFPVSELPGNDPVRAAVDDRAAAGYDGAYRGH